MKNPVISACLAVYNGEKTISKCINCLIQQNYKNLEICISVNKSEDKTKIIIEAFKKKKFNIKVKYQKKFLRNEENYSESLKLATGEFIFFIGHDDFLEKGFVKNCYEKIAEGNSNIICQSFLKLKQKKITKINFYDFRIDNRIENFLLLLSRKKSSIRDKKYNLFICGLIKKKIWDELSSQLDFNIVYLQERCIIFLLSLFGNIVISEKYDYNKTVTSKNFINKYPKDKPKTLTLSSFHFLKIVVKLKNISLKKKVIALKTLILHVHFLKWFGKFDLGDSLILKVIRYIRKKKLFIINLF